VTISTDQSTSAVLIEKAEMLEKSVKYLVDENGRSGSPFEGKLRATGIALMGHSTGGGSALWLARFGNFDIAAVATLSPDGNLVDAGSVTAPKLIELGSFEGAEGGNGQELYTGAISPKHLVLIEGANHFGYTDELCIQEAAEAEIPRSDQQRVAYAYLVAFLELYCRGQQLYLPYLDGSLEFETLETFALSVQSAT
jgi:hypothetical protein